MASVGLSSRESWRARATPSTPDGTPRPNWPAVVRRAAHSREAAMASGRVAARRRMLGIPMGRTPKSSEGGRMSSGSGLRNGRRRGEEKAVRTPAGMSWVRIPSRSHDRSWRACSRASWRCSGRHPSPPGLVLGVRCVIVWAHPSTRTLYFIHHTPFCLKSS
eukprot:scaffold3319_cov110-Isochrysis_galbana.AAC.2